MTHTWGGGREISFGRGSHGEHGSFKVAIVNMALELIGVHYIQTGNQFTGSIFASFLQQQWNIIWTEKNGILIYASTLMNTENIVLKERH